MTDQDLRVLLVEDSELHVRLFQMWASSIKDFSMQVDVVDRLATARQRLKCGGIDMIVLDLGLADCDGLETFNQIHLCTPDIPIVVLTGHENDAMAIAAVRMGAEDYLIKGQLSGDQIMRSLRYALERSRRHKMELALTRSKKQMQIAREIQFNMYPHVPFLVEGFDIAGSCFPADAVGGDYFDFLEMACGRSGIIIGDVAGHGIGSALLMAKTQSCLNTLATLRTLDMHRTLGLEAECPAKILSGANTILSRGMRDEHFVTLMMLVLDPITRTFTYANAAHPTGYVLQSNGQIKAQLRSDGFPLGVVQGTTYGLQGPVQLATGDLILLVTDGIAESRSPTGEFFGNTRLLNCVKNHQQESASSIVDAVYDSVQHFTADGPQVDDMTAVIIKAN